MRVIFNVPDLLSGKGGAERVAVELANRLFSLGHSVAFLCLAKDKPPSYKVNHGIEILSVPSMHYPRDRDLAIKLCKEFAPTGYFFFYSNGRIASQYSIGKLLGVPMGAQECTNPLRCIRNIATDLSITIEEAATLRSAILAEMTAIRMTMEHYVDSVPGFVRSRVFCFKNSFPNIKPSAETISNHKHWIINISGLGKKNKNGLALIKALPHVVRKHPGWGVLFVGTTSNREKAIRLANQLGVLDHIQIIEAVDDINPFYSSSAFHVICSFEEGCPNAVCEAMIHGKPSIGYDDCEGTKQLIRHNIDGLLAPRDEDGLGLASAINLLIENPELREELGTAAGTEAQTIFDATRIYETWLKLFSRLDSDLMETAPLSQADNAWKQELHYFLGSFMYRHFKDGVNFNASFAPSVDFIVPLYNKRAQIQRTLESILNVDYPSFRVIVVDDQSTDGSFEFVQQHFSTHPRVLIIRRDKNGGLSAARNTGLAHSTAIFIQFWDADDVYHRDALSALVQTAIVGLSDIVTGLATRSGNILPVYRLSGVNAKALKQPYCHLAFQTMSTCFKLYRREFLLRHKLTFVEGLYMQDAELNLRAFAAATSVSMTNIIVGEYTDDGCHNRGSQHISEARMHSALDIFSKIKAANLPSNTLPTDFSDFVILKFVFRFFIARLISPTQFERHIDSAIDRAAYIESFRRCIKSMLPGIQRHFHSAGKDDWRWGVIFGLLLTNNDDDALYVLNNRILKQPESERIASMLSGNIQLDREFILNRIMTMS
jgi:glycosyltransferase involved in cell wall biosynthesis